MKKFTSKHHPADVRLAAAGATLDLEDLCRSMMMFGRERRY
jgi:hypothetical protein